MTRFCISCHNNAFLLAVTLLLDSDNRQQERDPLYAISRRTRNLAAAIKYAISDLYNVVARNDFDGSALNLTAKTM